MSRKLYLGNLNTRCTKEDLGDLLSRFGRVEDIWVARSPPGFGFVTMEDDRDACDAVKELDGQDFMGQRIRVENAKTDHDGRGGASGGRAPRGPPGREPDRVNPYKDDGYGRRSPPRHRRRSPSPRRPPPMHRRGRSRSLSPQPRRPSVSGSYDSYEDQDGMKRRRRMPRRGGGGGAPPRDNREPRRDLDSASDRDRRSPPPRQERVRSRTRSHSPARRAPTGSRSRSPSPDRR